MAADIIERVVERRRRKRALPRTDHLAPKAESAIYRAGADELEEEAVWIAMHNALDRRVCIVADRIALFFGCGD